MRERRLEGRIEGWITEANLCEQFYGILIFKMNGFLCRHDCLLK